MKTFGMAEAGERFFEVCADVVETGEPRVVTRHGRPFVKIVPCQGPVPAPTVWDLRDQEEAVDGPWQGDFELPQRVRPTGASQWIVP